jgi:hypothetical protein
MEDVISNAMNAANIALENINVDDINHAIAQAGAELSKIDWDDISKDLDDAQKTSTMHKRKSVT